MDSLLKATAVAVVFAVLAATAEAAAGSAIATADFLMSPTFLWVAANAIIIWLLSSSRRGSRTSDDNAASSSAHGGEAAVHDAADSLYTSSSEYEYFSDAGSARRAADALPGSRRMARAARRADRPRVRKKPAGQDDAPGPRRAVASAAGEAREPDDERRGQETPAAFAAEPRPSGDGVDREDEDVSMDSLWQSIVQRRGARPVVVQKSESWGNDELPRLQRVAETAAATRREMRKSVSAVSKTTAAAAPRPPSALRQLGWRTRDVLEAIAPDELLRRAESFIRRQHEHLRLQRQESEQRQLQLQRRIQQAPALIRV
ncbi:uncharacterized protein C2845_PM01G39020 [Panicum miliaceum]|uniref:DUF4408 domain-containing protein n=1 Tax=Panicum miliaceum TaxID=4540 RepID=A0A3L6TXL1_PANMI|nr:uncharacterized protein C2845_PM01G39020 [Panicum miliaceum]